MTIDERLVTQVSRFSQWENDLKTKKELIQRYHNDLAVIREGIEVLTAVLNVTQERVAAFIESMLSEALRFVYGDEYGFRVIFELKRNQPEIRLHPTKDGHLYIPAFSGGIGVLDVCSYVLRYVCWALSGERTSSVMVHDEPFRNVHGAEENARLSTMVNRMSELLGLQIIIISGESVLATEAEATFSVEMDSRGYSQVKRMH